MNVEEITSVYRDLGYLRLVRVMNASNTRNVYDHYHGYTKCLGPSSRLREAFKAILETTRIKRVIACRLNFPHRPHFHVFIALD